MLCQLPASFWILDTASSLQVGSSTVVCISFVPTTVMLNSIFRRMCGSVFCSDCCHKKLEVMQKAVQYHFRESWGVQFFPDIH